MNQQISNYVAYGFILRALLEDAYHREDATALWLFRVERLQHKKELNHRYGALIYGTTESEMDK